MDKIEERLKSHYELLSRTIDFTKAADAKAAPMVALHIAFIGALTFRSGQLFRILVQCSWDLERISLVIVVFLYICSSLCAIAFAGLVFFPRTPRKENSLIYFEDIATMNFDTFQYQSKGLDPATIEKELLQQIFEISRIVSKKMYLVKWALIISIFSVLSWVYLMVCSSIASTQVSGPS